MDSLIACVTKVPQCEFLHKSSAEQPSLGVGDSVDQTATSAMSDLACECMCMCHPCQRFGSAHPCARTCAVPVRLTHAAPSPIECMCHALGILNAKFHSHRIHAQASVVIMCEIGQWECHKCSSVDWQFSIFICFVKVLISVFLCMDFCIHHGGNPFRCRLVMVKWIVFVSRRKGPSSNQCLIEKLLDHVVVS